MAESKSNAFRSKLQETLNNKQNKLHVPPPLFLIKENRKPFIPFFPISLHYQG